MAINVPAHAITSSYVLFCSSPWPDYTTSSLNSCSSIPPPLDSNHKQRAYLTRGQELFMLDYPGWPHV